MVGLSVILESLQEVSVKRSNAQVILKGTAFCKAKPPSPRSFFGFSWPENSSDDLSGSGLKFLDHCFLCKKKLSPSKDIYMYKGEMAFCSEDCRLKQIFVDEENMGCTKEYTFSVTAIN